MAEQSESTARNSTGTAPRRLWKHCTYLYLGGKKHCSDQLCESEENQAGRIRSDRSTQKYK